MITSAALDAIYQGSSGVPRLINRICDRALQRAYAARTMQVDAPFVWAATSDLGLAAAPVEDKQRAAGAGPTADRTPGLDMPAAPAAPVPDAVSAMPRGTTVPRVAEFRP